MADETRLSAEARELIATEILAELDAATLLRAAARIEEANGNDMPWRQREVGLHALELIDEALRRHDEITLGVVIRPG